MDKKVKKTALPKAEKPILKVNHRAKRILYLSTQRELDLEKYHFVKYLDYNEIIRLGHDGTMAFIRDFKPEIVMEREHNDAKSLYDDLILWIKANIQGVVTAVWLIDSHCIYPRHEHLVKNIYDFAFVAIYKYYEQLSKVGNKNVFWLPLCYPGKKSDIVRNREKIEHDITFVGRFDPKNGFTKRFAFLTEMKKTFGNKCYFVTDYENMEKIIRRSFVSLNCSLGNEINFRIFETIANGAELVTDYVPDIDLIKDLKNKVSVYTNNLTAILNIKGLLQEKFEHDVARNQIWIQNHHTLIHRHLTMIRTMETGIQEDY